MQLKLYVLLFVISLVCFSDCSKKKQYRYKDTKKVKLTKGVEFRYIPRGAMLKLLTGYEQRLKNVIAGRKLKPVFSAQFANNKHTNEYIYPDLKKKDSTLPRE